MPHGMKFRIVDKEYGEAEKRVKYRNGVTLFLIGLGISFLALFIWVEYTYGPAWPIYIFVGLIFAMAVFIWGHRERLIIDKRRGKVTLLKNFWGILKSVRDEWPLTRVSHFEAKQIQVWRDVIDMDYAARALGASVANLVRPGTAAGRRAKFYESSMNVTTWVTIGYLVMHLKTGEIVLALNHMFEHSPETTSKYANKFLKGEDVPPGEYQD